MNIWDGNTRKKTVAIRKKVEEENFDKLLSQSLLL